MPWKGEKDPYKIWLSEIILQQTRVEQGLDYYNRFVQTYPGIKQLAAAPDTEVFKLWEGLGYYSRCRNLLATARFISHELSGKFPETYQEILSLKGIGPYTASAIASFAYNLPYAVNDGNVMRVLARYFGIRDDIASASGKKKLSALAQDLLPRGKSALFNQAIMDFGATVCKPALPLCSNCPLSASCYAFIHQQTDALPVKAKKPARKKRYLYYLLIEKNGSFGIRLRGQKDIWRHLHEFLLIEEAKPQTVKQILQSETVAKLAAKKMTVQHSSGHFSQLLTHQQIDGIFIHVRVQECLLPPDYQWVKKARLKTLAFPKFINRFLDDYPL